MNIYTQNEMASNNGLSAGSRVICVKFPHNGRPHPLPPPYQCRGEIWGGSSPSEVARHAC